MTDKELLSPPRSQNTDTPTLSSQYEVDKTI